MALPADYKNSPVYQPVLRSVLKSQIQYLVEQLRESGEETLILTANVKNHNVTQLGSESGKQFVDMYDDFKSEFLGFCQRREKKRKMESPQTAVPAKRDKAFSSPVVIQRQSPHVSTNPAVVKTPKVSAARVLVTQQGQSPVKQATPQSVTQTTTQSLAPVIAQSVASLSTGQQVVFTVQKDSDGSELDAGAALSVLGMEAGDFVGYEEIEEHEVEGWDPNTMSDSSQPTSQPEQCEQGTSTTTQPSQTTTTPRLIKTQTKDSDKVNLSISDDGGMKTLTFARNRLLANTCKLCGKMFSSPSHVRIHLRSHSGEKPYRCEECDICYATKLSLRQHNAKVHNMKRY